MTVFERSDRVGGLLLSQWDPPTSPPDARVESTAQPLRHRHPGGQAELHFQWDSGANSMADDHPLVGSILEELGLESQIAVVRRGGGGDPLTEVTGAPGHPLCGPLWPSLALTGPLWRLLTDT